MRKVIFFMLVSVDGYFEGPQREIDWHVVDEEFNELSIQQLDSVDMLLFGRVTYELMAAFWPSPQALKNDPIVAEKMNRLPKIVFSRTLTSVDWHNTRLVKKDLAREIARLKQEPGKDLIIFGSSDLSVSMIGDGLIDEFRIMVNPVALGGGKSLFAGLPERLPLRLLKTRTMRSGNVILYYQPDKKQ